MERSSTPTEPIRFGVFELDLRTGELRKSGVKVRLQEQSFQILQALVKNPGEVVTREELRKTIWPADTFVEFDHGLYSAMTRLREVLGDSAETPRFIETLSRRGYRFVAPVDRHASSLLQTSTLTTPAPQQAVLKPRAAWKSRRLRWAMVSGATILVIGLAVAGWRWHSRQAHVLTENDTIVLADFDNTTGDPVFDGTLRQGLTVQFEQSPFFGIVSGERIAGTLQMMEKPPNTPLTLVVAREVYQRVNATAVIEGSISDLGSQYVLGLNAVNCRTGAILAAEQAIAEGKEKVLPALGKAATELRSKLGESAASLQSNDVPLDQATTSSLEALQAYSLGNQAGWKGDWPSEKTFMQRAVDIDPPFAHAYSRLGIADGFTGEPDRMVENIRKACELRDRASEREKFSQTSLSPTAQIVSQ